MRNWAAWLSAGGVSALVAGMILLGGGDPEIEITQFNLMSKVEQRSVINAELSSAKIGDSIKSLRTSKMEVIKLGKYKREAQIYSQDRNYLDPVDGFYKPKDLRVKEIHADAKDNPERLFDKYVDAGDYRVTWFDGNKKDFTFYKGDFSVEYTALHDTAEITTIVEQKYNGVKETITLQNSQASKKLKWLLTTNADYQQDGNEIIFSDNGVFLFRIKAPTAFDAELRSVPVNVSLAGDTLFYDVDIPIDSVYPIEIDPTVTIDDTAAKSGVLWAYSGSEQTARDTTAATSFEQHFNMWVHAILVSRGLFRFDTSTLPDDATISATTLKTVITLDPGSDFYLKLIEANDNLDSSSVANSVYNDFKGWAGSGAYTSGGGLSVVSDSITTASYTAPDTMVYTFNATGRGIVDVDGNTQFFLLAGNDIADIMPGGVTWFNVEDGSPYLTITYTIPAVFAPDDLAFDLTGVQGVDSLAWSATLLHTAGIDSMVIRADADSESFGAVGNEVSSGFLGSLAVNTAYNLHARVDSSGYTDYSNDPGAVYTHANVADAFNFTLTGAPGPTTAIAIGFGANSNPDSTMYAIRDSSDGDWVQFDGTTSGSADWASRVAWVTRSILSGYFAPNEVNEYVIFSRNEDNVVQSVLLNGNVRPYGITPTDFALTAQSPTSILAEWADVTDGGLDSLLIMNSPEETAVGYVFPSTEDTTITGLSINTLYTWFARADSQLTKGDSNADSLYTLVNPGIADSIALPTDGETEFDFYYDVNSNPAGIEFAIRINYITLGHNAFWTGADSATAATWQNAAAWGASPLTIDASLAVDNTYAVSIIARNADNVETVPDSAFARLFELTQTITVSGAGVASFENSFGDSLYYPARNHTHPDSIGIEGSGFIGQQTVGGPLNQVFRSYGGFLVPDQPVDTAVMNMTGTHENIAVDFLLKIYKSTWAPGDAGTEKFWFFDGRQPYSTAHNGTVLNTGFNTIGWNDAGNNVLTFNSDGIDSLEAARGDTARFVIISSKDVSATTPNGQINVVGWNAVNIAVTHDSVEALPSGFTMATLSATEVIFEWTDNTLSEYGFIPVNLNGSASGAQLSYINAEIDTATGLSANTLYEWKLEVKGGNKDGQYSTNVDSVYTLANEPGEPTISFPTTELLKIILDTNSNPAYTKFAVQDSITELYVHLTAAGVASTFTSGAEWNTYAQWGGAAGDTVAIGAGREVRILAKARSTRQ